METIYDCAKSEKLILEKILNKPFESWEISKKHRTLSLFLSPYLIDITYDNKDLSLYRGNSIGTFFQINVYKYMEGDEPFYTFLMGVGHPYYPSLMGYYNKAMCLKAEQNRSKKEIFLAWLMEKTDQ